MSLRLGLAAILLIVMGVALVQRHELRLALAGRRTIDEALARFEPAALGRLEPRMFAAGVRGQVTEIALIAFKAERVLELRVRDEERRWRLVVEYPVLGASGGPGPKLREGDQQVPEGVYRVESLNPNSRFHLSLGLDYPNAFDRARALEDGRSDPGSEIFVHGKDRSVGCLAIGDEAIEEVFVLVARTGRERARVLIAPHRPWPDGDHGGGERFDVPVGAPAWTRELYAGLAAELMRFR